MVVGRYFGLERVADLFVNDRKNNSVAIFVMALSLLLFESGFCYFLFL